jgi:peptidoglycan/xylan/chitin deacetylase (PgdA/CDA1 family)
VSLSAPLVVAAAALLGACIAPRPEAKAQAEDTASRSDAKVAPSAAGSRGCSWPNGAQAAVSLTYDDALASQLSFAVPVLNRYGIKATFFLSGGNMTRFAPLALSGHELASHTVKHPCNADLAALSLTEMASELDAGIAAVQTLGVAGKLTFAYPCGQTQLKGMESYVPLVKQRFRAARGVAGVVAAPESVDLFNVPALFPPRTSDGADVIVFIERAEQSHGWAVIGVHGVSEAGEYLQLSQPAHDKIVAYLADHANTIWTAPFGTVADVVAACP